MSISAFRLMLLISFIVSTLFAIPVKAQTSPCPTNMDHVAQGDIAFEAGNYDQAADSYTCAVEENRFDYSLQLKRMEAYLRAGRYLDAYNPGCRSAQP